MAGSFGIASTRVGAAARERDGIALRALVWWRTRRLTRPSTREALATRLAGLPDLVVAEPTTVIGPPADALALAREDLLGLAEALRRFERPSAFAVAMTIRLLTDGLGPLYAPASPAALREAVRAIRAELEPASVSSLERLWALRS